MVDISRAFFGCLVYVFVSILIQFMGIISPAMQLVLLHALAIVIGGAFYWFCCFHSQEKISNNQTQIILIVHLTLIFMLYYVWSVFFPSEEFVDDFFAVSNFDKALKLLTIFLLAPIAEEITYRGIIFDSLRKMKNTSFVKTVAAALVSSFVFMFYHGQYENQSTFVLLFLVALLLCSARYFSKTLWIPIVVHSFASLCAISL